jgi:hypothetical protein
MGASPGARLNAVTRAHLDAYFQGKNATESI